MDGGERRGAVGSGAGRASGAQGSRIARRAVTAARAASSVAAAARPRARRSVTTYLRNILHEAIHH